MTLNLPNVHLQAINQQYVELEKNKKEYEYTNDLINLYKTQFDKYDNIRSRALMLASKIEIIQKLKKFVKNTQNTFDERTLNLTIHVDNRIRNDNTWCIRNKLNHLRNDIYYIQYKQGKCFFGCKITDDIISFNSVHFNKIKSELEIVIKDLTDTLDKLKNDIKQSIDRIYVIINECKKKNISETERIKEKITENLVKIKKCEETIKRITNENNELTKDEMIIQKNIIENQLYFLAIKEKFMIHN